MKKLIPLFLALVVLLAACGPEVVEPSPTDAATPPPGQDDSPPPTDEQPAGLPALPPEPQEIAFQASDGQALTGYYYPAAVNPAPLVVFMHWINGNVSDWYEIAVWLQNRGQANPFPNPADMPWWDPSWFPQAPADRSYGVFLFSFRDCQPFDIGCAAWTPDVWLLDAQAAMQTALTLEGVDPTKIVAIGSSIGADGAPDACAWLNEQQPGSCQGALSLSPGGYMDIPYPDVVQQMGQSQPPVAAWCFADETEIGICNAASEAGNPAFRAIEIPGGGHGNFLLRPDLDPLPMQLILDFLGETVGE